MKQLFKFAAVAFAIVAAASCAKEVSGVGPEAELETVTLTAEIDNTKAVVATDGKVLWQTGDKIAVWVGSTKYEMDLVSGEGTTSAVFKGEIPAGSEIAAAAYPASQAGTEAGTVQPKTVQTIASGATCDPEAVVMTASAPVKGVISFKNACGGVRVTVAEGVNSMAIYYAEDEVNVSLPGAAGTYDMLLPVNDYGEALFVENTETASNGIVFTNGLNIERSTIANLGTPELKPCMLVADPVSLQAYLAAPETAGYITRDIDLKDVTITPCESFGNVLNGLGHSIINWKSSTGLIQSNSGTVKDIVIAESCSFTPGADDFAPFVINNTGSLSGLTNNGGITVGSAAVANSATMAVAGVAARSEGSISACNNNGSISIVAGTALKALYLGGVAGMTKGILEECENTGDFEYKLTEAGGYKSTLIGGVAAYCANKVTDCKNSGNLVMNAKYFSEAVPMEVYDGSNSTCLVSVMMGGIIGGGAQKSATDSDFIAIDCSNSGDITFSVTDPMTSGCVTVNSRHCFGGIVGDGSGRVYGTAPGNTFNKGDISVSLTCPDGTFKYGAGTLTTYIGGIAGSNYFSKTQSEMGIDYCENFGNIDYLDQNTHTTTHTAAGIVGWPGTESSCTSTTSECVNNGDLNINSTAELRIGGIQGGSGRIDKCTNNGDITVVNATATAQIGGIAGFHSGGYALNAVKNYGDISCDSDLTKGGAGGLAGKFGNSAMTLCEKSAVNCNITVKDSAYGGMVIGAFNGTTKVITCGTIAVKGSFNGEALTEDNCKDHLHGAFNYTEGKHIINVTYGDASSDDPSGGTGEPSVIKIMSFNIRHTGEAADTGDLLWDNRKEAVLNMILSEMPDIIGMQECDKTQKDWLMEQIEGEGHDYYKHVYPGGNKCIFFKLSTMGYTSGTSGLFYHSDTPNVSSKWDGMSSSRVTAWIPLVDKNTGRKIYYFNTHTDASSGHDDIRKREAELNVAQIQKICPPNSVQIISGDMNTANPECHAPFYPYFESSRTAPETDNYPTFNGFGKYDLTTGHYLDYIYVHGASKLIRHRTLVSEGYGVKYISDHWPVVLECEIK